MLNEQHRLELTEEDKTYIISNFKTLSASKIAKELTRKNYYPRTITGPIIYSIVNNIRIEIYKEIKKLKANNQFEKALQLESMLKVLLPNKKERVYQNIEVVVNKIFN